MFGEFSAISNEFQRGSGILGKFAEFWRKKTKTWSIHSFPMLRAVTFMVKFCFWCDINGSDIYGKRCDIYGELWYLWEALWHLWGTMIFMGGVIFTGRTTPTTQSIPLSLYRLARLVHVSPHHHCKTKTSSSFCIQLMRLKNSLRLVFILSNYSSHQNCDWFLRLNVYTVELFV